MAIETVQTLEVNVTTGEQIIKEVEMELPNPRIMEIEKRLQEIRMKLQETDYKQAKFIDGNITQTEYEPFKTQRNALRDEYNLLENELKNLI